MKPYQKIQHKILLGAMEFGYFTNLIITEANIDEMYDDFVDTGMHWGYESEFREGEVETGLACDGNRHYEAKAVAAKMVDGSWVGWTYWYGGGKHSDPGSIRWMEDAYALECAETEKLVVVREFKVVPE